MNDLTNKTRYYNAIPPAAATTDNTPWVSSILDTLGYGSASLSIITGSFASGSATFAVTIAESNNADMSSSNAVAAGDLVGTLAHASFTHADGNRNLKIGYKGAKRYLQATITPSSNAAAAYVSAVWALGSPGLIPLTDQKI